MRINVKIFTVKNGIYLSRPEEKTGRLYSISIRRLEEHRNVRGDLNLLPPDNNPHNQQTTTQRTHKPKNSEEELSGWASP